MGRLSQVWMTPFWHLPFLRCYCLTLGTDPFLSNRLSSNFVREGAGLIQFVYSLPTREGLDTWFGRALERARIQLLNMYSLDLLLTQRPDCNVAYHLTVEALRLTKVGDSHFLELIPAFLQHVKLNTGTYKLTLLRLGDPGSPTLLLDSPRVFTFPLFYQIATFHFTMYGGLSL